MTKLVSLPTTLFSNKGSAFVSQVIKEVAGTLGITLKHVITKHGRTIVLLERSHASIKQLLKIETDERRSLWHMCVSIAGLTYNTSFNESVGCESSRVFRGRIPYNILNVKMSVVHRHRKCLPQIHKFPLNKRNKFTKMSAKVPCKLTSITKRIMIKKTTPQI